MESDIHIIMIIKLRDSDGYYCYNLFGHLTSFIKVIRRFGNVNQLSVASYKLRI